MHPLSMLAVRRIIDQKFMLFFAFYKAIHNPVYFIQGDEGVFSPLYGVVDFVGRSEGSVLIPHSVHHLGIGLGVGFVLCFCWPIFMVVPLVVKFAL